MASSGGNENFNVHAMDKAVLDARSSWKQFAEVLAAPGTNMTNFGIKRGFKVDDNPAGEHLWLKDVTFDGTNFHGVIKSPTINTTEVKTGDKATVTPAQLSDWMYVEDGLLKGGFTVKVLLDDMPKTQVDAYLEKSGFRLE